MTKNEQDQVGTATLERRAEPRIKAGISAVLIAPNAHPMEACLLDLSSHGARLRIPETVPVGAWVRIEAHELLLSGTVTRCRLIHGAHEVGITLTQPMEVLDELRRLDAAQLAEYEPVSSRIAT